MTAAEATANQLNRKTQETLKVFYPPKCPICYYANTCDHKNNPSPTKACYQHKPTCKIYNPNTPETTCTCGFRTYNFYRYFAKTLDFKPPLGQPVLTVFCQDNPETSPVDAPEKSSGIQKKREK